MILEFINIKIIDKFENDRVLQIEQTQVGAPKLVYNGSDDIYKAIMASEFSFNLTVLDKTDGKFFHLYTGNEKRYYVLVEDQDENMLFEGFLLPDFYEEPYTNGVIFVGLTATDGIGLLKGNYLPYNYYEKETSVIELIAKCLEPTRLDKQIYFSPAIESAVTDYKWNEIAVNGAAYLESDDEVVYSGLFFSTVTYPARKNIYEILELVVKSIGCTLFSQGNKWFIEGINRKHQESQLTQIFDSKGLFIESILVIKNKVDLVFFTTPTISIKSPWKRIDFTWDIDEDGDLTPADSIRELGDPILGLPKKDLRDFWKANGALSLQSLSKELQTRYQIQSVFGDFDLGASLPPLNLYVVRSYSQPGNNSGSAPQYAEGITAFLNNFLSIKNRKYLKISDEFIERSLDIKINLNGGDKYSVGANAVPAIADEEFSRVFKIKLLSGNATIVSTVSNNIATSEKFEGKRQNETSTLSNDLVAGDFYTLTSSMVRAKFEKEAVLLPSNGFFDVMLFAPVSPDFTDPYFYGYVVENMDIKYTEQKKLEYAPERVIDFTTVYELDIFHGDSVQDLSLKQFRFRRPVYDQTLVARNIGILSSEVIGGLYYYNISFQDYQAVLNNSELFIVEYLGSTIYMNDLESDPFINAYEVYPSSFPGLYYLRINPNSISHPSGIGTNINDFNILKLVDSDVFLTGYEFEDNEWREQWKRYGVVENIRFVKAISKMYHDVQSGPLTCIEGTLAQTFFPREIGSFLWQNIKEFIPSRIEIDFSKGRTNVFMIESKHEIVTDYVNE